MNAKKLASVLLAVSTLSAVLLPTMARAHDDDVVVGALIGGIAGAAIGSNMGGEDSALVGAAIGSMTGAALASSNNRHYGPPVMYRAPAVRRLPGGYVGVPVAPARLVPVVYTSEVYTAEPVRFPHVGTYEGRHEWREHRGWREHQGWRGHDRGFERADRRFYD
jgi:hypothetical protein